MSDTNILSSFAAGDSFHSLLRLFARSKICIPPGVRQELEMGLDKGKSYLEPIFQAITARQVDVIPLSDDEERLLQSYPQKLNLGERQAIALTQTRKAVLLSNDKRAIRYCQQEDIRVLNLVVLIRLLWTRQIMSQADVRALIAKMEQVENLTLTQAQRTEIFAPFRRS